MVQYSIHDIIPGMVLARSITLPAGEFMLAAGSSLTARYIYRLKKLGMENLYIEVEGTEHINPQSIISTQVQRELDGPGGSYGEADFLLERIPRLFDYHDFRAVPDFGGDLGGRIEHGGKPVAGRRHPQSLGVVRPAVSDVVLAAAVDVRVVQQHGPAVLQAGRFVAAVAQYHVRGRQVSQGLEIGCH